MRFYRIGVKRKYALACKFAQCYHPRMEELPTASSIKERARKAGLTVAQLCRDAGLAPSILNRWDAGETSPSIANVARLLDALAKHESRAA